MKSVALTCGPTGGHLIPASLIANSFQEKGIEVVIFTTHNTLAKKLIDSTIPVTNVDVKPWAGEGLQGKFLALGSVANEYLRLRHRLEEIDAVLSLGGHTAIPVLVAAREKSIPIFIQEQNIIMGRANSLFSGQAQEIYAGMPLQSCYQQNVLGNPVREPSSTHDKWFSENRVLFVIGGSQGSREVSRLLRDNWLNLKEKGWSVFYVKGKFGKDLAGNCFEDDSDFRQVEFVEEMNALLPYADCILSRAGAGTIAEIIQYDLPAVLIPYEKSADNHQRKNAEWISSRGPVSVMPREGPGKPDELMSKINEATGASVDFEVPWSRDVLPQNKIVESISRKLNT